MFLFYATKMNDLRNFNTRRLFKVLDYSDDKFIKWLQAMGVLFMTRKCDGKKEVAVEYKCT